MSRIATTADRLRRQAASLAAAALCLGAPNIASADEPAARLLPPLPAPEQQTSSVVVRASSEEVLPVDAGPQPVPTRERPPDFKYPPPYSKSSGGLFDVAAFWNRKDDDKDIEKADEKEENTAIVGQLEQMAMAKGTYLYRQQVGPIKTQAMSASVPVAPSPEVPAWRWFGYGAPVPGRNVYAPNGVYGAVHPNYYHQTGATPGAIPGQLQPLAPFQPLKAPELPTLPQPVPTTTEPPKLMSRPVEGQPSVAEPPPDSSYLMPARLELPIQAPAPAPAAYGNPLSSQSPAPIVRAQAPEEDPVAAISASLRTACTGYATRVELTPRGPTSFSVRITLAANVQADRLAERISRLPEIAGYDLEMQFVR